MTEVVGLTEVVAIAVAVAVAVAVVVVVVVVFLKGYRGPLEGE